MNVIGIDPGKTGAAALLVDGKFEDLVDYTTGPAVCSALGNWLLLYDIDIVVLEQVHSMPKQGVVSTFNFGANYGWWQGMLDALELPWRHARPQTWAKGLIPKKSGPSDKPGLLVARRMYPSAPLERKKDHNRADAILIAYWGWQQLRNTG